jgi:outer membrane protein assembly factor BamB
LFRRTGTTFAFSSLLVAAIALGIKIDPVSAQTIAFQWNFPFARYNYRQMFCPSPAVADLGINDHGDEPDPDLEIVTGTDEWFGAQSWHCFDSRGNQEWVLPTGCDQSRTSVAIADIEGDGDLEIAGGTTSGWQLQVFDNKGRFTWTYTPPYYDFWKASPIICDVNPYVPGLEVIGVTFSGGWVGIAWPGPPPTTLGGEVFCFNGITGAVLWRYQCAWLVYSSPACGDVDADGGVEVVVADWSGYIYCLNGTTGAFERGYWTTLPCYSSPALVNVDGDPNLEIIIGGGGAITVGSGAPSYLAGSFIVCYDGGTASIQWGQWSSGTALLFSGGWIVSSPAVGDVDGDGEYEVVVGSTNGRIYCLNAATGGVEWVYPASSLLWAFVSSPALAYRGGSGLGIYIGCTDGTLYLLDGTGTQLSKYNTGLYRPITSSPAVADIDGDSKLEIMFTDYSNAAFTSTFWVLEDSSSTCSSHAIEWRMFRHDPCHTGTYPKATPLANSYNSARAGATSSKTDVSKDDIVHDVAITSLIPSKIQTVAGEVISSYVGVENQGDFTETFNVSLSYDGNIIETLPVELDAGANTTLTFQWNTLDIGEGLYNLTAEADVVPYEYETEDNTFVGVVPVREPYHDVATAYVMPLKTVVGQGYNATVNVTLINQGDYAEAFQVDSYANMTQIGQETTTLTNESYATTSYTWNTVGFARGNYVISSYASPVEGEDDTTDNNFTSHTIVYVGVPGDVDGNHVVNMLDLYKIALAFGANRDHPRYVTNYDIEDNGIINMLDLYIAATHFGQTDP